MGLREEKKRELRDRILATTLALVGKHGFGHTRVADVAAALRISEATFFNYFPTKHAVLDQAVDDAVRSAVARALEAEPEPDLSTVHRVAAELAVELDPTCPIGHLLARHPDLVSAGFMADATHELLSKLFADLQASGLARADVPARLLGDALLAVLWVAARSSLRGEEPDLVHDLERGAELFVEGVCAG